MEDFYKFRKQMLQQELEFVEAQLKLLKPVSIPKKQAVDVSDLTEARLAWERQFGRR